MKRKPHIQRMLDWFTDYLKVNGPTSANNLKGEYMDGEPKSVRWIPNTTAISQHIRSDGRFEMTQKRKKLWSLKEETEEE